MVVRMLNRLFVGCVAFAMSPGVALAFPDKPIRLVVPYAAGGSSDTLARVLASRLSETLGHNVIVENRAGAGGVIGTDAVAKSAADGYTLVLADSPHTINPAVYKKIPYDPLNDFTSVTIVGTAPLMLFVHHALAPQSLREFIALAKAEPGRIAYGSGGNGTASHLIAELFQSRAGVKLNHVPYKGAGPAITDTAGGQVAATFSSMASAAPQVKAGRLRVLAVTSAQRLASLPDVPTFAEHGVDGLVHEHWWGVLAPARTPREIVDRLRNELGGALNVAGVRERMAALGVDPRTNTPEAFRALLDRDLQRWTKVVQEAGVKVE
jgi:tripartite-type tricarboxylate transporter receptor subunit TctC